MIDTNESTFEIHILPSKTNTFSNSHSSSKECNKQWIPVIILWIGTNRFNKCFLLFYCKRMSDPLILSTILFNLCHNSICRILSDDIISNCHIEYRMKNCMDSIQCVNRYILLVNQMIIKELYI